MKILLSSLILFLSVFSLSAQTIEDLNFGTESTLEVLTWNLEWFPTNGQQTIDYVTQIIEALDVDVLAVQEINDTNAFKQLLDNLEDYDGYFKSGYYGGLELAYIYKKDVIEIIDIYEIYTTSSYWNALSRAPMVMEMKYKDEKYVIINNHYKCCGDGILNLNDSGDEESRRYEASRLLKEYIDSNFPNEKVIVLGDLNDILTDNASNNVFQLFFDDSSNYYFADTDLALSDDPSKWSYPKWPSHIDHLLVTNELFENYDPASDVQTIKIEDYMGGWGTYEANVSDHRPVAMKITPTVISGLDDLNFFDLTFSIYPNPFKESTTLFFQNVVEDAKIEIYNINGKKVNVISIPKGEASIVWDAHSFPAGVYFVKLISDGNTVITKKLILSK